MIHRCRGFASPAIVSLCVVAGLAQAQIYPTKPIRIIVPASPGGGTDAAARILAAALTQGLGQQVIAENRPGAGGLIGTEIAARSTADGYTLLMAAAAPTVVFPHTFLKIPYDPVKDLDAISLVADSEYFVAVHPSLGVKSIKELIALAKARPKEIVFGSSGNFSIPHLAGEMLKQKAGVEMLHVPYKGGGPAARALAGGEVSLLFGTGPTVVPLAQSGRLRLIATATRQRSKTLPELPTVNETIPGIEVSAWYGILAPKGTAKEIVSRLNQEIVKAVTSDKVAQQIVRVGMQPVSNSPEEFSDYVKSELARWGAVVKATGLPRE
jgi:tripartite-type tricarboxylate transporter receptor subunit TctC